MKKAFTRLFVFLAFWLPSFAASAAPFAVTDIEGRRSDFDEAPKTFIVANYIANFLLVGGAESLPKVVAITADGWEDTRRGEYQVFTESFPEIRRLPSIGGYHDDILNAERILALHPDVLLIGRTQYAENNQRIALFEAAGIRVVVLDYHAMKVANHTRSTEILGKLLGRESVAEEQNRTYEEALYRVWERVSRLSDAEKGQRVYMETASKGLLHYGNSYNRSVLWGAILHRLQANNLAENAAQSYAALDKEYVMAAQPEVIILGGSLWRNKYENDQMQMGFTVEEGVAAERLARFLTRDGWSALPAVQKGAVYAVDHGSLRSMADFTFTEYLAKILYPDSFADLDPEANFHAFYQKYLPQLKYRGTFMLKLSSPREMP